tara:strand:+ start:964 stop:1350 length:387 start_codon:yes stop_codon:yes gene_type:complete
VEERELIKYLCLTQGSLRKEKIAIFVKHNPDCSKSMKMQMQNIFTIILATKYNKKITALRTQPLCNLKSAILIRIMIGQNFIYPLLNNKKHKTYYYLTDKSEAMVADLVKAFRKKEMQFEELSIKDIQ